MHDLLEIRGTSAVAYEIRNGARVEFAAGDRATRMRALGCPETIIKKMREHRSAKRSAGAVQPTEGLLALVNGLSSDAYRQRADYERVHRATAIGRDIARQQDADLRARAARAGAIIAADAAQERKENNLRAAMENAAGIVFGRRSKADKGPYEEAGEGVPEGYPYAELASAVAGQLGHKLVGANGSQAFTKDRDGNKFTYSYSQDNAGRYTFGRQQMGGHPAWLGVGEKDVS